MSVLFSVFDRIAEAAGTRESSIRFLASLLICIPIGIFLRSFLYRKPADVKHIVYITLGLSFAYFNHGIDCLHLVFMVVGNFFVLLFIGGTLVSVIISFCYTLGYLIYAYVYVPTEDYHFIIWTTPGCVLCLRLIGLAFDVYDGQRPFAELSSEQKQLRLVKTPTLLEVASYSFYIGGFFAGPQFPARDYFDFIHEKNQYATVNKEGPANTSLVAVKRLLYGLFWIGVCSYFEPYYGPSIVMDDAFANGTAVYKCCAFICLGLTFYTKYLGAWMISEAVCNATGFGYNGVDEEGNEKWDKVTGVSPMGLVKGTSFKALIKAYNITTNTWCARYIYKRCKFLGNRYLSQFVTLMFLAIWHGLYEGYFICFFFEMMTVIPENNLEEIMAKVPKFRQFVNNPAMKWPIFIFLKIWVLVVWGYAVSPFIFLKWKDILKVYQPVYFLGHIVYTLFIALHFFVIGPYLKNLERQHKKDEQKKSE